MNNIRPTSSPDDQVIVEGTLITLDNSLTTAAQVQPSSADDQLSPLVGGPVPTYPAVRPAEPSTNATPSADPEFDAYLAVVKLLLGGAIEGTAELARRLERLEAQLRAAEDGPPGLGEVNSTADAARYMIVGASLSAAEGLRRQAFKLVEASDLFWRATGSAVAPLTSSRLTGPIVGPFDRAFARLVDRGQKRVNDWVELGRANEPAARVLAREAYLEIVDDFIGHLSQNDELAGLVQAQSVGLASEFVDEVRERTVSADTLAESVVRRILKRPPRTPLPPPDMIRQAVAEVKKLPSHED